MKGIANDFFVSHTGDDVAILLHIPMVWAMRNFISLLGMRF